MDQFSAVGTVSLGYLNEGSHRIALIGTDFSYYAILDVPSGATDSLFRWDITTLNKQTSEVVPDFPIYMTIGMPPGDTALIDTTDESGVSKITYSDTGADSIRYNLRGDTWAHRGIPEVITFGVDEYWIRQ